MCIRDSICSDHGIQRIGVYCNKSLVLNYTRKPDGAIARVKIINVTPSTITWDENHALAGKDLVFTIRLIEVQKG